MDGQTDEPNEDKALREGEHAQKEEEQGRLNDIVERLKRGEDVQIDTTTGGQRICASGVGANEAVLDAIYEAYNSGTLTEADLWNKYALMQELPLAAPLSIKWVTSHIDVHIKLFIDGDKWCALIGEDLQEGTAGFGDTKFEAIADCVANYEPLKKWYCMDCGKPTDALCVINFKRDIGRCPSCNMKNHLKVMPPPPLETMESASGDFTEYAKWPHCYIPPQCPYCNENVNRIFVGSYHDHVCHEVTCEKCKVYFGFTD